MQNQSPEFLLFTKGMYEGESKSPEAVFGLFKNKVRTEADADTYIKLLSHVYNETPKDSKNYHLFPNLGCEVLINITHSIFLIFLEPYFWPFSSVG